MILRSHPFATLAVAVLILQFPWSLGLSITREDAARQKSVAKRRPVEQIDLKTGEMLAAYPSVGEAAAAVGAKPPNIHKVLAGSKPSCKGYFWRQCGSMALPPGRAQGRRLPVEMVCLESGKVMNTFPSVNAAARAIGTSGGNISGVVSGRLKSAGGYFWREQGSKEQPPSRRGTKGRPSKSVEQLDLKTGTILAVYPSLKEAAEAVGTVSANIGGVMNGKLGSCKGYFWRQRGSTTQPSGGANGWKPVEMICPNSGEVLNSFPSMGAAAHAIGASAGNISSVIRGRLHTAGGYFWRYQGSDKESPKRILSN
jgi:NUMOD1 domain